MNIKDDIENVLNKKHTLKARVLWYVYNNPQASTEEVRLSLAANKLNVGRIMKAAVVSGLLVRTKVSSGKPGPKPYAYQVSAAVRAALDNRAIETTIAPPECYQ